MKRSFAILTSSIILLFLAGNAFGRQVPLRRIDKVAPKLPRRKLPLKIGDSTTLNVIKTGSFNADDKQFRITASTLKDGTIFTAWEAFADKAGYSFKWRAGWATRYNTQLRQIGHDMIYTITRNSYFLESNNSVPLANGNVLLAFNDKIDNQNEKGTFVLLSPTMKILLGPVIFSQSRAASVSATPILDGDAALIAYSDSKSTTYQGKYLIVNSKGEITTQPKAFTFKGDIADISAGTTWNGKAFIAYNHSDKYSSSGSLSIEVNALGNLSRNIVPIWNHKTLTALTVCPLSNKNTLVLSNWNGSGQAVPVTPNGKATGAFQAFHPQQVNDIQATKLSNDNVFVSFIAPGHKAKCVVLDSAGKLIKGPVNLCEPYKVQAGLDCIAQTKLHSDMVIVITHGFRTEPPKDSVTTWTVLR